MTDSDRLLRHTEVTDRLAISRSTLYAMVADGRFPPPIHIGRRAVRWREADVVGWLTDRAAESVEIDARRYGLRQRTACRGDAA